MNDVPTQTGGSVETANPQASGQPALVKQSADLQGAVPGSQLNLSDLSKSNLQVSQCQTNCAISHSSSHIVSQSPKNMTGSTFVLFILVVTATVMAQGIIRTCFKKNPSSNPETPDFDISSDLAVQDSIEPVLVGVKPQKTAPKTKKNKKTKHKKRRR